MPAITAMRVPPFTNEHEHVCESSAAHSYSAASSSLSLAIAAAGLRPLGQVFEPTKKILLEWPVCS